MGTITAEKIKTTDLADYREESRELVASYFRDGSGRPIVLTDGQCDIFNAIWKKVHPRVHIESHTRYGKSLAVALGVLMRVSTYPEKFSIVAGTKEQSAIIMSYILDHIFDHRFFANKFKMDKGESEESIRRYKNKSRINFVVKRVGGKDLLGEVFITNAKGALGFGAPNVILDEAALVSEDEEALVFRMLGDDISNFYFKISNSWDSEHFRKSAEDPRYLHLKMDWKLGLKEGRISIEQVEEARTKPFFRELYECKFPPRGEMDEKGWTPLLTKEEIDKALVYELNPFGVNKLGGDVAGGGANFSVVVQRHTNVATILLKNNDPDTMDFAEKILAFRHDRLAGMDGIFIDEVGEGKGASDILVREIRGVFPFNGAEKPDIEEDQNKFVNIRAMCYWRARQWILDGGKLHVGEESPESTWYQLAKVKYKRSLELKRGKLQIMSKEEMRKIGVPSPDVADAFMMTFLTSDETHVVYEEEPKGRGGELFDKYGLFPHV